MVKKILIMPYFGELPNYFHLWLSSCEMNPDIDWLIVTDNVPPETLPSNIIWINKTFCELRQDFQKKLEFKIWLETPYKLCDYKCFYGYLFSEYLRGYDFWGYCDCDVIFGDIGKFLPETLFSEYDKLLRLGHLSFVRNVPEINENFRKYDTYKVVLTSPVVYAYDEAVQGYRLGFAGELLEQGYRFFEKDALVADVDYRHYPFRIITSPDECCIFSYENGKLYKLYKKDNETVREEVMYVHLQKRKMQTSEQIEGNRFLIYPNVFAPLKAELLEQWTFWENASTEREDYFDMKAERWAYFKRDIQRFFHEPCKLKSLRYRFRK